MASIFGPSYGTPNLIVIGVPDVKALLRVRAKLEAAKIPHYNWEEPDYDFGFTAIATAPLYDEQRKVLRNYRVWSYSPGAGKPVCLGNQDGGAKFAMNAGVSAHTSSAD